MTTHTIRTIPTAPAVDLDVDQLPRREYARGLQLIVKRVNPTIVSWAVLPSWANEDETEFAYESGLEYHPRTALQCGEWWLDYFDQMFQNIRDGL